MMKVELLPRLLAVLFILCGTACAADTTPSDNALAEQRSRAAALYRETFGADNPAWGKLPEAFRLWSELADRGDANATYYLSSVYFRGISSVVEANGTTAIGLLRKAAEKRVPDAQFALAWQLESGAHTPANHSEAVSLYQAAADGGSALAMSRLVRIYTNGEMSQSEDKGKASYWRDRLQQLRRK